MISESGGCDVEGVGRALGDRNRCAGPITFKGEWKGQAYEDKGVIQEFTPNKKLSYTHYSPLMGKPDAPENYHTVAISLSPAGSRTRVSLDQDNNDTEQAREHSAKNWTMMLESLKKYLAAKPT